MTRIDWRDVSAKANGVWPGILEHFGVEMRKLNVNGPCPLCAGNDRQHFYEREGRTLSYCRGGCGNSGPGNEVSTPEHLLMTLNRWDFGELVKRVADYLNVTPREHIQAIRRESERRAAKPLNYPASHREDKDKAMSALAKCTREPNHIELLRENTAPSDVVLVLKGLLAIEMYDQNDELVNVAAIREGNVLYSAGGPSFGATARLKPFDGDYHPEMIVLCQDYAASWRLWWRLQGKAEVRCAVSPENFVWMTRRAQKQFTHVACSDAEKDELKELGLLVMPVPGAYDQKVLAHEA